MVLVGKVFELREEMPLEEIAGRLRDYKSMESFDKGTEEMDLVTEIKDLSLKNGVLRGSFSRDRVVMINQRGKIVPVLKTIEAPIFFHTFSDKTLLSVLQEKYFANAVAAVLSQILFITFGAIVEARIPSETLQEFHERNPDATKVIFFDDVDIPNINKLSLYGETLKNSSLYEQYLGHGKMWYVVYTSRTKGAVLGLTRNCVVTAFSRIDEPDFVDYIVEEIFGLIE